MQVASPLREESDEFLFIEKLSQATPYTLPSLLSPHEQQRQTPKRREELDSTIQELARQMRLLTSYTHEQHALPPSDEVEKILQIYSKEFDKSNPQRAQEIAQQALHWIGPALDIYLCKQRAKMNKERL